MSSDEEEISLKAKKVANRFEESDSESESENEEVVVEKEAVPQSSEEYDEIEEMEKQLVGKSTLGKDKLKKLTPEKLEKERKRIRRTGVVYLSSIPPYMKPVKVKQIMAEFGNLGRTYLQGEDARTYRSRVKGGGNKKKKFTEGWVEFVNKKEAKLAAETLNGNIIGGKKSSFYHDDILNVKYLKGFKWQDLTRALSRETEVRESKMEAELALQRRMDKAYIDNVEQSKRYKGIREHHKRKGEEPKQEVKRTFKQRRVVTNRADAKPEQKQKNETGSKHKKLEGVLNSLF